METTIQVQSATINGNFCNIKTVDGKQVTVIIDKCPKLMEVIKAAQDVPYSLKGNMAEKNGKSFLWEPKPPQAPKRLFNGQPKNEKLILAQTCVKSACELHAEKGGSTATKVEDVLATADSLFAWCMIKAEI